MKMVHDELDLGHLSRPIVDERHGHQQPRSVRERLNSLDPQALKHRVAAFSQDLVERLAHLPAKLIHFANIRADRRLFLAPLRPPRSRLAPGMEARGIAVVVTDLGAERTKTIF